MSIVYKVTNMVTGRCYVGQTTNSLASRWAQHQRDPSCIRLFNSIRKHGVDKFKIEVIDAAEDQIELDRKELKWISDLNSLSPNGYNLRLGGRTGKHSEITKQRMSKSRLGWKPSEETKKRMSESKKNKPSHLRGKRQPEAAVRKSSIARSKPVYCLNNDTIYLNAGEAEKALGLARATVSRVAKGRRKSIKNYKFEFVRIGDKCE